MEGRNPDGEACVGVVGASPHSEPAWDGETYRILRAGLDRAAVADSLSAVEIRLSRS
jgi:hypothetical protein